MLWWASDLAVSAEDACDRLRTALVHPGSRVSAGSYLQRQQVRYQLLALYQTLFPDEYATSQQSLYLPVIAGDRITGHSDREIEFLQLLDERLFPVSWWMIETAYSEMIEAICAFDMGISWQNEEGYDSLVEGWQLLIPFTVDGHWFFIGQQQGDYEDWFEGTFGFAPLEFVFPEAINLSQMRKRFRRLPKPLCYFPLALSVLDKTTGNCWLDEPDDLGETGMAGTYYPWSEENVRGLARKWRGADAIRTLCSQLIDWIQADFQGTYSQIIEQWNKPYANS